MDKVYTIGYEGKEIEDFISLLEKHDIKLILDVRSSPHSRREDFDKGNLKKSLFRKGIKYKHIPELGGLDVDDYEKHMEEKGWLQAYEDLKKSIGNKRSALMCLENDPMKCHRRYISEKLEKDGLEVIHIGGGASWKSKQLDDF